MPGLTGSALLQDHHISVRVGATTDIKLYLGGVYQTGIPISLSVYIVQGRYLSMYVNEFVASAK